MPRGPNEKTREAARKRRDAQLGMLGDFWVTLAQAALDQSPAYQAWTQRSWQPFLDAAENLITPQGIYDQLAGGGGTLGMTKKMARRFDTARKAAARRAEAQQRLAKPIEWSPPPEKDWLLDRSLIRDAAEGHPGVPQVDIARAAPGPRQSMEAVQIPFRSMPNKELVRQQIQRGRGAGGEMWYQSTYPIRARMEEIGMPGGPTFEDFAWANSLTSPQSKVAVNAPTATALMTLQQRGLPMTMDNLAGLQAEMASKYGPEARKYFATQNKLDQYLRAIQGQPPSGYDAAEKITSYGQGLLGNLRGIPLDTHELAGLSYGTRAYPYWRGEGSVPTGAYGVFEDQYKRLIDDMGLAPTSGQASRWIGGGELTGLRTGPGDYLSILEDLAWYKAMLAGEPTAARAKKELDNALLGIEPLLPYYKLGRIPGRQ